MTNGDTGQRRKISRPNRRAPLDPERLSRRRAELGLTQMELAAASGVSTSSISRAEFDGCISPRGLRKLAVALDCQVRDLMRDPTSPEAKSA